MMAEKLQHEYEILECPDKDFQHMGRRKMVFLLPKTGYNKYSELYWPSYVHFNFGATFRAGSCWRRALPPHFSRHLLHIHQFQHSNIWLRLFGDMPSHPALVGTCFTFISFSIVASSLGSLEMCPSTPCYVDTCYFIKSQHHGYGSTTQDSCHRSPFASTLLVS